MLYIFTLSPSRVAKTFGSKARNSRLSLFILKAAKSPQHSLVLGAPRTPLVRFLMAALPLHLVGAQASVCPSVLTGRGGAHLGPNLGKCALAARPILKAALTLPAARRPGLSRNPDLEARALSWLPPTGGIKAAAVLVAPSLVYLLTCAHPSGTTSSFE